MSHETSLCYTDLLSVTPSDTAPCNLHGFYVGGAGNVAVETEDGTQVTFTAMPVGTKIDNVRIAKIRSTGTTATLIIGFVP